MYCLCRLCCSIIVYVDRVVLRIVCVDCALYIVSIVLFYVLFVCKYVLYYCHQVSTKFQLRTIYHMYHITSYIIYHIIYHTSYIISYYI